MQDVRVQTYSTRRVISPDAICILLTMFVRSFVRTHVQVRQHKSVMGLANVKQGKLLAFSERLLSGT